MLTLEDVNSKMLKGKVSQQDHDPEILYRIASQGKTYVEIGAHWGGSAIIAGLAGCEVHCIDPWEYPNKQPHDRATPEDVRENWANAGLDTSKLHLYRQRHPPWPEKIQDMNFDIGLIDGQHYVKECRQDWEAMRVHITKYVLFHDVVAHWEVQQVFWEAVEDPEWINATSSRILSQFGVVQCVRSL